MTSEDLVFPNEFTEALERLRTTWSPPPRITPLRRLSGRSGAYVYIVDVSVPERMSYAATSTAPNGHFILKLIPPSPWSADDASEAARHLAVFELAPEFARTHLPDLIHQVEVDGRSAILYRGASPRLLTLLSSADLSAADLRRTMEALSYDLLVSLNTNYEVIPSAEARSAFEPWLSYRLDPQQAPRLREFIAAETQGQSQFILGDRVLLNPIHITSSATDLTTLFVGLRHGDLHLGNILATTGGRYSVIDWALSDRAPLFFDHSYLELSLLIELVDHSPNRILSVLSAAEHPPDAPEGGLVSAQDIGTLEALRSIRRSLMTWQQENEPDRADAFDTQVLLSRVAASLNWINKPISDVDRRVALAYGGLAAIQLRNSLPTARPTEQSAGPSSTTDDRTFLRFWNDVGAFDPNRARYVLISDVPHPSDDAVSLGQLPWSAVIDFDAASDGGGLFARASSALEQKRSIRPTGLVSDEINFSNGTCWFFANGWDSRSESTPASLSAWRHSYLHRIRRLSTDLSHQSAPLPLCLVILSESGLYDDRIARTIEAIDEATSGTCQVSVLGSADLIDDSIGYASYRVPASSFFRSVAALLGNSDATEQPTIPGSEGDVGVPLRWLRNLQEDLDVLHSNILTEVAPLAGDVFLRGGIPTWLDLDAGRDIRRPETEHPLASLVLDGLQGRGIHVVRLNHAPGAGGSTIARRVAWDLRRSYPVVVVRRIGRLTAERLSDIYAKTGKPVLALFDGIPEPQARDIFDTLNESSVPLVALFILRDTEPTENDRLDASRSSSISVPSPMAPGDATRFFDVYSVEADDVDAVTRLRHLTNDRQMARLRLPFFYGLVTFEQGFHGVERYVAAHLEAANHAERRLTRQAALVTRFSQQGIPNALFARLMAANGLSWQLDDLTGDTVFARLFLSDGSAVRLSHPIIADEVLRHSTRHDEEWRHAIADMAIDFIEETVRCSDPESEDLNRLFESIFIRRDSWAPNQYRNTFSEIVRMIPTDVGRERLLRCLTRQVPDNPHYWNHLGRHLLYARSPQFDQARACLKQAIEIDPGNGLHHHTFGMILRMETKDALRRLFRERDGNCTPDEVLQLADGALDTALESFKETRRLRPNDNHGFVTAIQMIFEVAERVLQSIGVSHIAEVGDTHPNAARWLWRRVGEAGSLLNEMEEKRGPSALGSYELACRNMLSSMHGDFEALITSWEGRLGSVDESIDLRRALANAYHSRAGRRWDLVPPDDARRVVDLMEANFAEGHYEGRDVLTWLRAVRSLPEFSFIDAVDRLTTWALRDNANEAYYYLYVLQFIRWYLGLTRDERPIIDAIRETSERRVQRGWWSDEWLSHEPVWFPVVSALTQGRWNRNASVQFFERPQGLARSRGTIVDLDGAPRIGRIRLERSVGLTAFFVPGAQFRRATDLNQVVTFNLGFSYTGLRAWRVRRAAPRELRDIDDLKLLLDELLDHPDSQGGITAATLGLQLNGRWPNWRAATGHQRVTEVLEELAGYSLERQGGAVYIRRQSSSNP